MRAVDVPFPQVPVAVPAKLERSIPTRKAAVCGFHATTKLRPESDVGLTSAGLASIRVIWAIAAAEPVGRMTSMPICQGASLQEMQALA